jgi:hypothetical protein
MQAIATAELSSNVSHDKILVIFGGLLLVMLLAALDSTIVATALQLSSTSSAVWTISHGSSPRICSPKQSLPRFMESSVILYGRKRVLRLRSCCF